MFEGPLWLVGMMGSGKSTIAPLVAELLGRDVVDTDSLIERRSGRTISELFAESEAAFRGEELAAVRSVAGDAIVVAVGGGAVTTEAAEIMAESGVVVWLRAEVATLASRLTDDDSRPLLLDDDGTRLFGLASERAPLYAAVASGAVDTDGKQPEAVAREVVEVWMNASSQV